MLRITLFFPALTEIINAKFPDLVQWRIEYPNITQKKNTYCKLNEGN